MGEFFFVFFVFSSFSRLFRAEYRIRQKEHA